MGLKTLSGPRTRLNKKEIEQLTEIIESYVTVGNFSNQYYLPPASIYKIYHKTSDTCSEGLANRLREIIKQVG